MTMLSQIIIYKSKLTQNADEFWAEHPEWILYGLLIVVGIVIACMVASTRKTRKW